MPAMAAIPAPLSSSTIRRLDGIEAARGVAAASVVLYHVARHVDKAAAAPWLTTAFQSGHAGVDLFFVLSGFIILHTHRADIGQPSRLFRYVGRRFTRVLPLYWIALGVSVAIGVVGRHGWPAAADFAWSASLLPTWREPILGVAWTLQYEAVFYAFFAVLICSRAAGMALLASWLALIVTGMFGAGVSALPPALTGGYALEFFLGMCASLVLHHGPTPLPGWLTWAGILGFATAGTLESRGVLDGYGDLARVAYGVPAMLTVLGLAAADQAGRLRVPGWLAAMGSASYSIYLFQFVFIGIVWQILQRFGMGTSLPTLSVFAILAAAALGGGMLMRRAVERPLLARVRDHSPSALKQA